MDLQEYNGRTPQDGTLFYATVAGASWRRVPCTIRVAVYEDHRIGFGIGEASRLFAHSAAYLSPVDISHLVLAMQKEEKWVTIRPSTNRKKPAPRKITFKHYRYRGSPAPQPRIAIYNDTSMAHGPTTAIVLSPAAVKELVTVLQAAVRVATS